MAIAQSRAIASASYAGHQPPQCSTLYCSAVEFCSFVFCFCFCLSRVVNVGNLMIIHPLFSAITIWHGVHWGGTRCLLAPLLLRARSAVDLVRRG